MKLYRPKKAIEYLLEKHNLSISLNTLKRHDRIGLLIPADTVPYGEGFTSLYTDKSLDNLVKKLNKMGNIIYRRDDETVDRVYTRLFR